MNIPRRLVIVATIVTLQCVVIPSVCAKEGADGPQPNFKRVVVSTGLAIDCRSGMLLADTVSNGSLTSIDNSSGEQGAKARPTEDARPRIATLDSGCNGGERGSGIHVAGGPPPILAPFAKEYFVLVEDFPFKLGPHDDLRIRIPKGFVTDLASVPSVLQGLYPNDGPYMSAAIVHDYLYWDQRCTKRQADLILKHEMEKFGIGWITVQTFYEGVHEGGQKAWDKDGLDKLTTIQVIPEPWLTKLLGIELDSKKTWDWFQGQMKAAGLLPAPDSGNGDIAKICGIAGV